VQRDVLPLVWPIEGQLVFFRNLPLLTLRFACGRVPYDQDIRGGACFIIVPAPIMGPSTSGR
jgi:hypothetical protein